MYCAHCGAQIPQDSHFCTACGSRAAAQSTSHQTTTQFGQFGGPQPQYSTPPPSTDNIMALVGLICAFVMPIVGLIFSILGLQKAREMNGKGRTMSLWGLWLSIIQLVLAILFFIIYIIVIIWAMGSWGEVYH